MPLSVALVVHSIAGGLAGGVLVGLGLMVWSAIDSGGRDWAVIAVGIGAWAGFVVGAAIGVLAALLRTAVLIFTSQIRWQVVAVVAGAAIAPIVVLILVGVSGLAWFGLIVGALAAVHLGRLVAKRLRRDRAEGTVGDEGAEPAGEGLK
jgi:hypothetical protein